MLDAVFALLAFLAGGFSFIAIYERGHERGLTDGLMQAQAYKDGQDYIVRAIDAANDSDGYGSFGVEDDGDSGVRH